MKRLLKANPIGVALVIVFILLIVIGVVTSKGAERRSNRGARTPVAGMLAPQLAAQNA